MVNHAGAGDTPNVIAHDYVFPDNVPDHLRHLVPHALYSRPHRYSSKPGSVSAYALRVIEGAPKDEPRHRPIPSQVLISTRELQDDEELLVDYRFNPHRRKAWPSWYSEYDPEASRRRWSEYRF
jgi:hypothetical protein